MSEAEYLEDGADYLDDDCDGYCENCDFRNECDDAEW